MIALVPNLPVETRQPTLVVDSRELGIGFFQIALRVRDEAGNFSTNPASALIFVNRGPGAVAVLRSPPVAIAGRGFTLFGTESMGNDALPVTFYDWRLTDESNQASSFRTRNPTVSLDGPPIGPADPLPRNLRAGRYQVSLTVFDDSGAASLPDEHPLLIVPRDNVGRRPVALPQLRVDGRLTEQIVQGTPFELDATESVPTSAGFTLERFLWTWLPFGRTTQNFLPWEQLTVPLPRLTPPWNLLPGLHRFRLVVFDVAGNASDPTDLVAQVNPS